MTRWFSHMASLVGSATGSPYTFAASCALVLLWLVSGPLFNYSDTWQLVINTGTTVVTFLLLFVVQNTQNRDARAMHLKLDEIILKQAATDNALIGSERSSDEELAAMEEQIAQEVDSAAAP